MLDERVARATYDDIIGRGKHLSSLFQVGDESYEHLVVQPDTTRLQTTIHGRVITYDYKF